MTMTDTLGRPLRPALDRPTAMRLAGTEYDRFADLLRSLGPDDWNRPTECPGWDVRQMAAHALGMVELAASLREQRRQLKLAKARHARDGGMFLDALTGLQVDERAGMTPAEIIRRFAERGAKAATGRRRTPALIRRRRMPEPQDVGGREELWTIGFLVDVILTRDPWMHRADIVQATGAANVLTADHDGVLVADIVAEWAARHGRSFALRLTGPAGGSWSRGTGEPVLEMDAIDFCRAISGRRSAEGLLSTQVPF
jgi:uncharacterized protein (TIGR03083 family)